MTYLVDTHVFLWWMCEPEKLSKPVFDMIEAKKGDIVFSSVSGWEIAIKSSLGKIDGVPIDSIETEVRELGWVELPFSMRYVPTIYQLKCHHHDPFDRALIAQAMVEDLTIISRDAAVSRYPVRVYW